MARELRKQEVADAVTAWAGKEGLTVSSNEKGFTLMPGDITVYAEGGKLVCTAPDQALADTAKTGISEKIMEMAEDSTSAPKQEVATRPHNPPAKQRSGQDGSQGGPSFDLEAWRKKQSRSYSAAGKEAPNAFSASEEANRRGFDTQIMDSGRTKELVWGHVRVTDPRTGQFREDRVSHEKDTFVLLKAWEDANAQARYQKPGQPNIIIGIAENSMPEMNPDVKIKGMPAPLWLTMTVMRSWSFADRDAITKAERRAQLKMLNREWREDDEIILEQEEERAVRGE